MTRKPVPHTFMTNEDGILRCQVGAKLWTGRNKDIPEFYRLVGEEKIKPVLHKTGVIDLIIYSAHGKSVAKPGHMVVVTANDICFALEKWVFDLYYVQTTANYYEKQRIACGFPLTI